MRRTKRLKTSSVIFLTRSISFRLLLFLCSLQTNTTNIAALQKKTMPTGNCSPGLHIQQVPTTLVIHTTVPVILKNLMSICTPVHTQLYPGTNTVVPRYKHSCTPVQTQLYPGTNTVVPRNINSCTPVQKKNKAKCFTFFVCTGAA
jgi:hypothetical protein